MKKRECSGLTKKMGNLFVDPHILLFLIFPFLAPDTIDKKTSTERRVHLLISMLVTGDLQPSYVPYTALRYWSSINQLKGSTIFNF